MSVEEDSEATRYWRTNLRLVGVLLVGWFVVSYGAGILLVEPLNEVHVGGFPLGFWFAQQGSIVVFIGLILFYCLKMDRIDAEFTTVDEPVDSAPPEAATDASSGGAS